MGESIVKMAERVQQLDEENERLKMQLKHAVAVENKAIGRVVDLSREVAYWRNMALRGSAATVVLEI